MKKHKGKRKDDKYKGLGKINSLRKIHNCQECGISDKKKKLFIHHIKPKSRGGANTKENLVKVCGECHKRLDYWALQMYYNYLKEDEEQKHKRKNIGSP